MKYVISFLAGALLIAPLTYYGLGLNKQPNIEPQTFKQQCESRGGSVYLLPTKVWSCEYDRQ